MSPLNKEMKASNKKTSHEPQMAQEEILRILIVDDMKTIRAHTRNMLIGGDYIIEEATNGIEAIARATVLRPHLVLLDITMPKMDGITCCKKLKQNPLLTNVKVVMVTGKGEYRQIAEAFRAGCDDYITKPINNKELLGKVEDLSRYMRARNRLRPLFQQTEEA